MYALLGAQQCDVKKILCFASEAEAQQFKRFVLTHNIESGTGGQGAYYIDENEMIILCDTVPNFSATTLNTELVQEMLQDVLSERTAEKPSAEVDLAMGRRRGAITFLIGELPQRQKPTTGDRFRMFTLEHIRGEITVLEGRVISDPGDGTLKVISVCDEYNGGPIVTIKADRVMKIRNY